MNLFVSDGVVYLELVVGVYIEFDDLIGQCVVYNLLCLCGKCNFLLDVLVWIFGVSWVMLVQIEFGCSVLLIKVLCKIVQGFKVLVVVFFDDCVFVGVVVLLV